MKEDRGASRLARKKKTQFSSPPLSPGLGIQFINFVCVIYHVNVLKYGKTASSSYVGLARAIYTFL
jgi:hypothetical protein